MASSSDVTALLHKELSNRNIDFSIREDGAYEIEINGYQTVMNVEDFARVCDSGQIVEFVDALVSAATHLKTWETAKPGIRFMAAAAGVDFGEAVYEEISDTLCRLLVHIDPVNGIVSRLMAGTIIEWGQTKEAVEAAAASNMRDMLTQSEIRIEQFEGHRIGIVSAEFFNASVLFSPNLRELVEPSLGWPVFALIPSQDSCYIVPEVDEELLPQLGPMIVREFETEDDPVSTEVFVVSDSGILSIASFDDDSDDSEQDVSDSGMRTIDYGDGAIRFRIPAHWGEEHQDDCGLFFENSPDSAVLRLQVMPVSPPTRVNGNSARDLLAQRAEENATWVEELENGNALISYVEEANDEGEVLFIQYWIIANAAPPDLVRVALFSFTIPESKADDEETTKILEILHHELRQCTFGDYPVE